MKVKLALAVVGALFISLLPGCRDFTMEEYQEARAERAEAQAKVAELEAELEAEQETITRIKGELEAYQTEVAGLEAELEISKAKITELEAELEKWQSGELPVGGTTPPEPPAPLQEEDLRYKYLYEEFRYRTALVHVAMLSATWNNNELTVLWELTNTSTHKIRLDYLGVKARDQMWIKGEWKVEEDEEDEEDEERFSEEPRTIYPTLQEDVETPWPGEVVPITTVWKFGPVSEEITIVFVVYDVDDEDDEVVVVDEDEYNLPEFTVTR